MSEDERPRRRASERAVDPVSRVLLATAEGHQEYIDNVMPRPWWHAWVYNWVIGCLDLGLGGLSLLFYYGWWFPLAFPLGLVLLVIGAVVLVYPWMHRSRQSARNQRKQKQGA